MDLNIFFNELLRDLRCHQDTRAYIISIFTKYKSSEFDFSKENITLLFAQARFNHDFLMYQNLGDWIFFTQSWAPEHFKSEDYYQSIARLSYYSCYKLINKQWKLFEELSDQLPYLEFEVRNKLSKKKLHQM